jgi:hypothetical protein
MGWVIAISSVTLAAVLSFWGWLVVKVMALSAKIAELEQRVDSTEENCKEHRTWSRNVEAKVDAVAGDTALICGHLGIDRG